MKYVYLIFFLIPLLISGQEEDSLNNHKKNQLTIDEINFLIKVSDSIGNIQKEGISEGEIRYNHISGNFGWEAYFLNDTINKNQPLRIRYSETQPKTNEDLNLYYNKGKLIFAELITTQTRRKLIQNKPLKKVFYFAGNVVIYPSIIDSYIDCILEKERTILKTIYN